MKSKPNATTWTYYLPDALGSVRQLSDSTGQISLAQSYAPFGDPLSTQGSATSNYGFTGEWTDATGLLNLRARYMNTGVGRFNTKDVWGGDDNRPMSQNSWLYGLDNPIRFTDPTGFISEGEAEEADRIINSLMAIYNIRIRKDWGYPASTPPLPAPPTATSPIPTPTPQKTPHGTSAQPSTQVPIAKCGWISGNWNSVIELDRVLTAVSILASRMGNVTKFRSAMQHVVDIVRYDDTKIINSKDTAFAPHPVIAGIYGDVLIPDSMYVADFHYQIKTIIHELGHVWDLRNWGYISLGLQKRLGNYSNEQDFLSCIVWSPFFLDMVCGEGYYEYKPGVEAAPGFYSGPYGGTNPIEDWAEAFSAYIYPEFYLSRGFRPIGPIREQYVREKINALP